MENESKTKDYDKPRYSQKDLYVFASKAGVVIVFLVLIYARFINSEDTLVSALADIEAIKKQQIEDKSEMYRHVASKDAAQRLRLDTKTQRVEESSEELKEDYDKLNEAFIELRVMEKVNHNK